MINALATNPLARAVGLALLQFVWQGAVIGGLTAIALIALRRTTANVRYLVACAGLAAMVAAPVVTVVTNASAPVVIVAGAISASPAIHTSVAPSQLAAATPVAPPALPFWSRARVEEQLPTVLLVWSLGVLLLTLHLLGSWIFVERIRRGATRPLTGVWKTRVQVMASQLGIARAVRVVEASRVDVPTVIGWLRPMILIPASAIAGLTPPQLEAVIAHELAHVRRHDYLVNILQSIVETLLFYHPAVWWVSKRIRVEREHCCDDMAVALCGDRVAYASALASLEELRGETPGLATREAHGVSRATANRQKDDAAIGGELLSRVRRLLGVPAAQQRRSPAWLAAGVAVAVISVFVAPGQASVAGQKPIVPGTTFVVPDKAAVVPGKPAVVPVKTSVVRDKTPVVPSQNTGNIKFVSPQATVGSSSATEAQIKAVEERLRVAKISNDLGTVGQLLDEAFVTTNQNGNTRAKADELSQGYRLTSLTMDSLTVRVADGTAIATGTQTEVGSAGTERVVFTRVWKRDAGGTWRLLSNAQFRDPRRATVAIPAGSSVSDAIALTRGLSESITVRAGSAPQTAATTSVESRPVSGITAPRKIRDVKPAYPQIAQAAKVEGIVILEAVIAEDGAVSDAQVLRSQPLLDQAAIDAVRQWKFTPTLLDGRAVPVRIMVTVNFTMQ